MKEKRDVKAGVMGISRFRIGRDGNGITTLVAFQGCPLRCKFCINPDCWKPEESFRSYTPQELYDELKKDDLYFRATEGGVTFGGGEPALRADFIAEFRKICGPDWKIRIETSLNCEPKYIEILAPVIDEWIIDTKAENPQIYLRYTGGRQSYFTFNLQLLTDQLGVGQERITLKVPIIPGYVSEAKGRESYGNYSRLFPDAKVEVVRYKTEQELREARENDRSLKGKELCNLLAEVRHDIAERYDIDLPKRDCTHQGDCPGTCPLCEQDVERLGNEMRNKGIESPEVSENLRDGINAFESKIETARNSHTWLMPGVILQETEDVLHGDIPPKDDIPPKEDSSAMEGQITEVPPYHKFQNVAFKECALAGVSFHLKYDDELWHELEEGMEVALVRHKNNKYDPNAVAVALPDDYEGEPDDFDFDFILGYVPRSENAELAALLDAGYADKLSARITTFHSHGNINNRIRITIYLQTSEPVLVRPDLLRAQDIDIHDLRIITYALLAGGTFYARFGGSPLQEKILPTVGEKIVFIHEQPKHYVVLLMRVIAEKEDCRRFTEAVIDRDDDRLPFILTNIIGPISLEKRECRFLKDVAIKNFDAASYLTEELSDEFERLFRIYLANKVYCDNIDADPSIDDPELRK